MNKTLVALVFMSGPLLADVIGTIDIGGSTASVSSTSIDFNCDIPSSAIPGSCPSGDGNALINNVTGSVSPFFLEGVFLENLTAATPVGTPLDVSNWMTITPSIFNATMPVDTFDLTFLPFGVFTSVDCGLPAAQGQTCTPPGSNFNLENTQTGFTASFDVLGNVHFTNGTVGTFTGTFTSAVNGESYQQALAVIAGGGSVTETYTASFALSTVPEPRLMGILAIFAVVVSLVTFVREKRKRT